LPATTTAKRETAKRETAKRETAKRETAKRETAKRETAGQQKRPGYRNGRATETAGGEPKGPPPAIDRWRG